MAFASRVLSLGLPLALLLAASAGAGETNPDTLTVGEWISGPLAAQEVVRYRVEVPERSYLYLVVYQRGVDLAVRLVGPDGHEVLSADGPGGSRGQEVLAGIVERPGAHRVEISADSEAGDGSYQLKLGDLRSVQEGDDRRAEAELTFALASQLSELDSRERIEEAIAAFGSTLEVWRELSDTSSEAATLNSVSWLEYRLGNLRTALRLNGLALEIRRAAADKRGEANALSNRGVFQRDAGELAAARESWERALELWIELEALAQEAITLNNLGLLAGEHGDATSQLKLFERALAIQESLNDPFGAATTLTNLGLVQNRLGLFEEALASSDRALEIVSRVPGSRVAAGAFMGLGSVLAAAGDLQGGLRRHEQAREVYSELGDLFGQAEADSNLGVVYYELGRVDDALQRFQSALATYRVTGARRGALWALNAVGRMLAEKGREQEAVAHLAEGLSLAEETGNETWRAILLDSLGRTAVTFSRPSDGRDYLAEALRLRRENEDLFGEARTLRHLGTALRELGELEEAERRLGEALVLASRIGDRRVTGEARVELARLFRARGELEDARVHADAALAVAEGVRSGVLDDELRASYLAARAEAFELLIGVLMDLHKAQPTAGFDAEALAASERSRARSLLDLLQESDAEVRRAVAPDLLQRELGLRRQIGAKDLLRARMMARGREKEAEEAAGRVQELLIEHRQLMDQIRVSSPRYAALGSARVLDASSIQRYLVDEETLLIEFSLGSDASYGWVVGQEEVMAFELPPRAQVERAVRRTHGLLTERNRSSAEGETRIDRLGRIERADAEYWDAAQWLTDHLLVPALAGRTERRLVIVPDGALGYVPFSALPVPGRDGAPAPLVETFEIVTVPSASVAAYLQSRDSTRVDGGLLAVVADPVFEASDPRVQAGVDSPTRSADTAAMWPGTRFSRLRFSRTEAEGILSLVPSDRSWVALDFAASRDSLDRAPLETYRWVHFATHGVVDDEHPLLSGLVLSLVDSTGEPRDGFLRLQDIYGLELDADMVVLSGCRTALGRELRGEGLLALTRGFFYAGARRVVASLWDVQDKATRELMERFYRALIEDGLPPEAALRKAQREMWRQGPWRAPYYWAAFGVQGAWARP